MWPSLSQTQEEAQTFIRPVVIVDSPYNNGMNPIVACVYHTLYAVWLCVNVFSCLQTLLYNQSNEHFHPFIFTYCQSFDSSRFICLISGAIWDKDAMMNFPCISQSSSKRQQKRISKGMLDRCVNMDYTYPTSLLLSCESTTSSSLIKVERHKNARQSINSAGSIWCISIAEIHPTECSVERLIMSWEHKALSLKQHV